MNDMDFNEGMMPSTNGLADPNEDLLGTSHTNPFDSGFDAEHPFPTYEQLRNAGFSSEVAHNMIDGLDHAYSQKELYHVLYESDDPLTAYNEMMDGKVQETCDKIDELVDGVEKSGLLGNTETTEQPSVETSHYNKPSSVEASDDEKEIGSCDCRSECRYNTGSTYKYADYGYSD